MLTASSPASPTPQHACAYIPAKTLHLINNGCEKAHALNNQGAPATAASLQATDVCRCGLYGLAADSSCQETDHVPPYSAPESDFLHDSALHP